MNLQFYIEKLENSPEYKDFIMKNPDAFLCGGFFVFDKKNMKYDRQNIDFFIPDKKEMVSFDLKNFHKGKIDLIEKDFIPEKISSVVNVDFNKIQKMLERKISENNIQNKIEKFLFSLQKKEGKNHAIGTIFLSRLALIKFHINLDDSEIVEFEKKNFFDILKFSKK